MLTSSTLAIIHENLDVILRALTEFEYSRSAFYDGDSKALAEAAQAKLVMDELRAMDIFGAQATGEVDENGLLPCPFCGGKADLFSLDDKHIVWCRGEDCPLGRVEIYRDVTKDGIDIWNRRATLRQRGEG